MATDKPVAAKLPLRLLLGVFVCLGFTQSGEQWATLDAGRGISVQTPVPAQPLDVGPDEGGSVTVWRCSCLGQVYVVTAGKFAKDEIVKTDTWIAGSIDGLTQHDYRGLVEQKEFLVDGWPAFQAVVEMAGGKRLIARGIRINPMTYALLTITDAQPKSLERAERFFNSFSIPPSIGKGKLTQVGPSFTSYPLDHHVSVTFPEQPQSSEAKGSLDGRDVTTQRYVAYYANRTFIVTVSALPAEAVDTAAKRSEIHSFISDQYVKSLGEITEQRTEPLGNDPAIWYDVSTPKGVSVEAVTVLHGNLWVTAAVKSPKVFAKSQEVSDYLHSLKIEN